MKKIILMITTLLVCSLTGCYKVEEDTHINDVVDKIVLPSQVSFSFDLPLAKDNVALSWESNDGAIKISNDKAIVKQNDDDVSVNIKLTAKRNNEIVFKDYIIIVNKLEVVTSEYPVYTIEEVFDLEDDSKLMLECVTVADSYSSGTHFTDGYFVIYAYGVKNLTVGDTYELTATKSSYGTGVNEAPQISNVVATKLTEESEFLEPIISTVENIETTTNFSYYNVTGTIKVDGESIFITNGTNKVEVSSYNNTDSLELLYLFENNEVNLNVYLTGGHTNRTVLTYVDYTTISASDEALLNAASSTLSVASTIKNDITLPTSGLFNTTISWESNNESVLSNDGIVNRLEDSTTVTLTATISLNGVELTQTFNVVVLSSLQNILDELFISEYYEGKSYDKYIEIYNPCDYAIDLSSYTLKLGRNGTSLDEDLNLSGILESEEVFVICNKDTRLNTDLYDLVTDMGTNAIFDSICGGITGDDSIGLFNNGELIDLFGVEGGTSKWTLADGGNTEDHRIIRKPGFGANSTWDTTEWSSTAISASGELLEDLGRHTFIIGGNV